MKLTHIASLVVLLAVGSNPAAAQQASGNLVVTGVQLIDLDVVGNVLTGSGTVTGTLAGLPFTDVPTEFTLRPVANDPGTTAVECAILNLELGPINLKLLGLHVDTSPICLEVTAIDGGGLLGDLLCDIAGGGLPGTGTVLPTGALLGNLLDSLKMLLNGALNNKPSPGQGGDDSVCSGQCVILELVLGPVDLTLLGLNVLLDDCSGGPVQVCVSASRGEGLLGDLLCGLANSRLLRLNLPQIAQLATRALALAADGSLSKRDISQLTVLLAQINK